jgi:Flp pilus assembly protein TadG
MPGSSTAIPRAARPERRPLPPCGDRLRRPEAGTALVLVPAMTLVLLCLGAIGVDLSLVHAAHRQAHRVASVAAEDGASMIDERELQHSGTLVLDADRATSVALAHVSVADLVGEVRDVSVLPGTTTLDVTLTVDVPHVLAPSLPGHDGSTRITVSARGRLHR